MPDDFDPYHKWLGIPATERPANHYRLLGIPKFEESADVISNAADARMAFIRTFQGGPRGTFSQQILNELAIARTTLLNAPRKANYDAELRAAEAAQSQGMAVIPVAAEIPAQPDPRQQQAALELQRQLEAVRAREAQLAQQQAQYTAALAQAEALRHAQAQREAFVQQREAQLAAARPQPAQPDPFAALAAAPAILASKPKKKSPWDSIPIPVLVGAIAVPAMLLLLLVGYFFSRDGKNPPIVEVPKPPIVTPTPPHEGNNSNTTPIVTPAVATPASNTTNKPVDLLALVKTPGDIRGQQGTIKDGNKLSLKSFGGYSCVLVPYDLPDSYQVDLKVTPRSGDGLIFGLNIGGRPCMFNVDGFGVEGGTRSALETIEGRRPHDTGYSGKAHMGKLLKEGVESSLTLKVVGNSFEFLCDGQTRVTWSGDPSKLNIYGMFDQKAPRKLFVGCWSSQYDITSLSVLSLDPPGSSLAGIDLLKRIDLKRDSQIGSISLDRNVLSVYQQQGFACLRVPYQPPQNYQLDLKVVPRGAPDALILGISVGGRPCMIGIDGGRNGGNQYLTALEMVDGRRGIDSNFKGPLFRGQVLHEGVESKLSIRVVGGVVQMLCEGKQVFAWNGDPKQLSIHPMFGSAEVNHLFVGSWDSRYEVSSLTLQPLDQSAPKLIAETGGSKPPSPATGSSSPATTIADTRPWRWARHPGDCKGFTLTPDRKRSVGYHVARAPWSIHGMDVSTGDYDQRLDGQGTVEGQYTFAAGLGAKLVAFSLNEGNNSAMLVKSMPSGQMADRVYGKKPADARYVFSADGKFLASSGGRDSAIIQLHSVETGNPSGRIASSGELTNAFVERMFAENGQLLVVYSGQKAGTPAEIVVAFDWQTLQPKRNWQITPKLDIRGMTFENDLLWVWGAEKDNGPVVMTFRAGAGADGKPDYPLRGASAQGTTVSDIHIPTRTAAIVDANGARLSVRNWGNNGRTAVVEYKGPVRDARFVEDGKAIVVQPIGEPDPTVLWETASLLDAQRVTAPTLSELGLLNNPQLAGGVKAVQRKDLKGSSVGSAIPSSAPSPATRQSSQSWRWARHPAKAKGVVLSPDGSMALLTPAAKEDEPVRLIDLQTGRRVATRTITALDEGSPAIDNGPGYFLAATDLSEKKRRLMLTPLAEGSGVSSHFKPIKASEIRFAFSGTGEFAQSEGKGNAAITVRNCRTFQTRGTIEPPKGVAGAFVEHMLTDWRELGVLYTARGNKSLVCYYDWENYRQTKRYDLPAGDWVGMRRAGDDLWFWGRDDAQRLTLQMLGERATLYSEKLPASVRIADVDYQRVMVLLVDTKSNRLLLKKGSPKVREWTLEYTGPLIDARFSGDGSAFLAVPQSPTDPIVCWDVVSVLNLKTPAKAPKLEDLGASADAEQAVRPPTSGSPSSSSSTPSSSTEAPSRELAKAEIGKLGVPMPGGTVNFLNINSDRFTEEHARLLTSFDELDGLSLQRVTPTAKMIEYLGQLPNLKNLNLIGMAVTDEQLAGLAKAPKLERLLLQSTSVKGEGLKHLAQVPLKSLNVLPEPNAEGWEAIGQIKTLNDIGAPGGEFGDQQCAAIAKLPNLTHLRLFNARKITGEGMKHIGGMTHVQQFDLPQGLKDEDLAPLKNFANLNYVSLPDSVGDGCIQHLPASVSFAKLGAGIGDTGLADLVKRCPRLQNLELLRCTKLTGQGFAALKDSQVNTIALPEDTSVAICEQLAQAKSLQLLFKLGSAAPSAKPLTAAHLKPLRAHPALQHIELGGSDDDALAELGQIPNLKWLHMSLPTCKAKGLVQLAKADKLEQLVITASGGKKTEFGEAEATALQSLTQLKNLRIFGVTFTPEQVQQIKVAMPKTQVEIQP